ncbi:MAG: deoxyguanosinetriphosphate triphosphohydrolase [Kineosporiaceae bacterium]
MSRALPAGLPAGLPPGYDGDDVARWADEPPKSEARTAFARDRARVLHSAALRRLAAKTQVVAPGSDDFGRNRLTHSLEVAQVGRDLAGLLGCDPDVVDTACLAHDLGHPPFGHNGESVLDLLADRIGGFEGNAQTLRVLTRLEPKVVDRRTGRPAGLNLTRACLDAATKYPWPRGGGPAGAGRKFGAYRADAEVFDWVRRKAPPTRACVEAQVMDLADDVAYSVHDVEDAVVAGYLDPAALHDPEAAAEVAAGAAAWYLGGDPEVSVEALARLLALPWWVPAFDGSWRSLAALKDLTSQLIGRFVVAVRDATAARHGPGPLTRHAAEVVVPPTTRAEIAVLKAIAIHFVVNAERRQTVYARQRTVIAELVEALLDTAPDGLERPYADAWRAAADDDSRRRVVVDQVAGLTDASAVAWHTRLVP